MFPPYDVRNKELPNNLRDQFVSNSNGRDSTPYNPYQRNLDEESQDDFDFGGPGSGLASGEGGFSQPYRSPSYYAKPKQLPYPPPSNYNSYKDTKSQPPPPPSEYEMSAFPQQPTQAQAPPHVNPFQSAFDSSYDPEYSPAHNYRSGLPGIPIDDPKDPYTFNEYPLMDYPDKPQPPLPPSPPPLDDSYQRMKQNERNRLKQLRRKPRFHYTKLPYLTILLTTIQVIVFIVELAKMSKLTGSAFQTKPYFNPMLGPSTYVLINMGARYVPCMHQIINITNDTTIQFPCPNSTSVDTDVCSLRELCGLSGVPLVDNKYIPGQWYRIFVPIFLHAGFLHIIFNLLLQVTMGSTIERNIGFIKYFIIYVSSGIAGFLLGSNFSPNGIASTGASGALFGIMATNMVMFAYCGKKNTNLYGTKHYGLFICIMIAEIVISLVLGLLPGLDNFSHIGGFAMGLLTSILLLPDPFFVYIDGIITYNASDSTWQQGLNNWNPLFHFADKIPVRFYIWCGARVVALVLAIVYFVTLAKDFFNNDLNDPNESKCKWCKYINCIPVHGWCDIGEVTVSTTQVPQSSALPSASAADAPQPTSTDTPLPSSIENGNGVTPPGNLGGFKRKRRYHHKLEETFGQNPPVAPLAQTPKISQDSFTEQQAVGIGFYFLLALLSFSFLKKKLSNSNR